MAKQGKIECMKEPYQKHSEILFPRSLKITVILKNIASRKLKTLDYQFTEVKTIHYREF